MILKKKKKKKILFNLKCYPQNGRLKKKKISFEVKDEAQ